MSDTAIRGENLSKRHKIGQRERYKALRDVITDAFASPFRRLWGNSQWTMPRPPLWQSGSEIC